MPAVGIPREREGRAVSVSLTIGWVAKQTPGLPARYVCPAHKTPDDVHAISLVEARHRALLCHVCQEPLAHAERSAR